ncbi:hypothetical protein FRC03_005614 [Tulasnella sp. 419]|nr:hypothetical protein FRC03_005614 [Tulasnella sp. 419]
MDFVLFEDILTAIVMAWTVVIGGEEYEIVIKRDIRQTLSSLFVKRIQADALEYHQAENDQSVRNSQRKNGDLQLKFSEVYWKLLREFVKKLHAMKKSDVITTPEATYHSLLELIELGADQLPFLSDIKAELESLGEQSPLMTQLASSIPRLEFSESASEIPEDETTLLSPFIWLPAPSKLSKAKAKTTKYASDGIDGLWVEAKKEYINQMPRRQASMLAEYDLTRKINGVNRLLGGNVTELFKGTMREDSMKNQV